MVSKPIGKHPGSIWTSSFQKLRILLSFSFKKTGDLRIFFLGNSMAHLKFFHKNIFILIVQFAIILFLLSENAFNDCTRSIIVLYKPWYLLKVHANMKYDQFKPMTYWHESLDISMLVFKAFGGVASFGGPRPKFGNEDLIHNCILCSASRGHSNSTNDITATKEMFWYSFESN